MDDTTGKKKSTDLVRTLLLDRGSRFAIILLFLLVTPAISKANSCDSTSSRKVRCFEKFENGQTSLKRAYKNGKRHGVWVYYHSNGTIDRRIKYRKGQRIWTYIYSDEKIAVTIDRNGKVRKKRECDCY